MRLVLVLLSVALMSGCLAQRDAVLHQAPAAADPPVALGNVTTSTGPKEAPLQPSPPLPQVASVVWTGGLVLRPLGSGWGAITLNATTDTTVPVSVRHDTMKDLGIFARDGAGIYDAAHYTAVLIHEPGKFTFDDFRFVWWGTPEDSFWPDGSNFDHPDQGSLHLVPGHPVVIAFASNVGNYTLHIGAQAPETRWQLAPRAGNQLLLPTPSDTAILQNGPVEVQRHRQWLVPAATYTNTMLIANGWYAGTQAEAWAGVGSDQIGFRDPATQSPLDAVPGPRYSVAPFGGGYEKGTSTGVVLEARQLELFRDRQETRAGIDPSQIGAGFLTFPIQ